MEFVSAEQLTRLLLKKTPRFNPEFTALLRKRVEHMSSLGYHSFIQFESGEYTVLKGEGAEAKIAFARNEAKWKLGESKLINELMRRDYGNSIWTT